MKLSAAAVLSVAFLSTPLFAQTISDAPPAAPAGMRDGDPGMHHGGPGMGHGMHHGGPGMGHGMPMGRIPAPVTNAPFSAKYTVESQHTAPGPDGIIRKMTTTESVYRDSLGRTRQDITMPARPPQPPKSSADGAMPTPTEMPGAAQTMTVIFDPVANTITRLMPERKIAIVENVPADFFKRAADREARSAIAGTRSDSKATVTELGSKTFAGIVASGRLTSHTVDARDGDTSTVLQTMTRESWFSPDLKIEVSSIETGGHGMHSDTLATLTRAEPDASLFKVPEGYTIQNAPAHAPGGMHHGGRGPGEWNGAPDEPPPPPAM